MEYLGVLQGLLSLQFRLHLEYLYHPLWQPMRLLSLFFFLFVALKVPVAAQSPDTLIAYKEVEGDDLNMHVFYPEEQHEKAPAIVFFFGGGWNGGTPAQFYPHARYFASLGMVGFAVEYRTKTSHGTSPFESVEDAMSAMRWVRAHAEMFGVDPNRIVASGGSAGGHLAAATGMLDAYDAPGEDLSMSRVPDALVMFNPVIDNGPSGYGHERIGDRYETFSPFHNVNETAPPMVIFLGTKDRLIPVETMVHFQEAVHAQGVRCDVHLYGGQPHGFFNYRDGKNPYYNGTMAAAEAFLRAQGMIDDTLR